MTNKISQVLFLTCAAFIFLACSTRQNLAPMSEEEKTKQRVAQSKSYGASKNTILRSSIAALQDLNFVIDSVDKKLGFVSATRFLSTSTDDATNDAVNLNILVSPETNKENLVRISANFNPTRPTFDKEGGFYTVEDMQAYQNFFLALDKAIFFETEGL